MSNNKWVSSSFVIALKNQGADQDLIRRLAKEIPQAQIFEDCAKGFITPEEGATLLLIRRESNNQFIRWIVSLLSYLVL